MPEYTVLVISVWSLLISAEVPDSIGTGLSSICAAGLREAGCSFAVGDCSDTTFKILDVII